LSLQPDNPSKSECDMLDKCKVPSEACKAAGDPVAPPVPEPTPAPRALPPPEDKAELAAQQDKTIVAVGKSKAAKPDPPAPKPDLPAKYTDAVGGSTGASCEARCADGAYIKSWKLRAAALVDSIQGLCSDGNWLKACGGDGGALSEVPGDSHTIPVRSGSVVDKFNDKGGNGGAASLLNCGSGYKIAGYSTLVANQQLSRVKLWCAPSKDIAPAPSGSAASSAADDDSNVQGIERQQQTRGDQARARSRDGLGKGKVEGCKVTPAWANTHLEWCPWGGWGEWGPQQATVVAAGGNVTVANNSVTVANNMIKWNRRKV